MRNPFACSGRGLVQQQTLRCGVGNAVSRKLPDTLLGFETTGPCPFWGWLRGDGVGVLLPCFGGGVWCLICG